MDKLHKAGVETTEQLLDKLPMFRERLEWFEGRFSRRAVGATRERLEEAFRQLTSVYYGALQDYFDRAALD